MLLLFPKLLCYTNAYHFPKFSSHRFMFNLLLFSLSFTLCANELQSYMTKISISPMYLPFHNCLFSFHSPSSMLLVPTSPSSLSTSPPPYAASHQHNKHITSFSTATVSFLFLSLRDRGQPNWFLISLLFLLQSFNHLSHSSFLFEDRMVR